MGTALAVGEQITLGATKREALGHEGGVVKWDCIVAFFNGLKSLDDLEQITHAPANCPSRTRI